jgi:hypothetical protein
VALGTYDWNSECHNGKCNAGEEHKNEDDLVQLSANSVRRQC